MIIGVMIMIIMKIIDNDWIIKIYDDNNINNNFNNDIKKIQKFKINFCVEFYVIRIWDGIMSELIFFKFIFCYNRICIISQCENWFV